MESHCKLAWTAAFGLLLGSTGAYADDAAATRELARVTSPDKRLDLVVAEVPTGATASSPFEVFLVAAGKVPSEEDMVLKVDNASQPEVEWQNANAAILRCEKGRVWHFQNFGSVAMPDRLFLSVSLSLACGEHGYKDGGT